MSASERGGDRDFGKRNVPLYSYTTPNAAKVWSHSDALEISLICICCVRPPHQSCRPETECLHVRLFAPIVSGQSLGQCTLVAVNKRDVHRVEQATSGRQATVCKVYDNLLHAFVCTSTSTSSFALGAQVVGRTCSSHTCIAYN